jgi:hypothetical protein
LPWFKTGSITGRVLVGLPTDIEGILHGLKPISLRLVYLNSAIGFGLVLKPVQNQSDTYSIAFSSLSLSCSFLFHFYVTIYHDSFKVTEANKVRMSASILLNKPVEVNG